MVYNDSTEHDNDSITKNKSSLFKFWKSSTQNDMHIKDTVSQDTKKLYVEDNKVSWNQKDISQEDINSSDEKIIENKKEYLKSSEFDYKPFTDRTILNENKLDKMLTTEWNEHVLIFHPNVEHTLDNYRPDIDLDCGIEQSHDENKPDKTADSFDCDQSFNRTRLRDKSHRRITQKEPPINFNKSWEHSFEVGPNDSSKDDCSMIGSSQDDTDNILVDPSVTNDKILREYWGTSSLISELPESTKMNLAKIVQQERRYLSQVRQGDTMYKSLPYY